MRFYVTTIQLLLTYDEEKLIDEIKQELEYAMNTACTQLEENKISPTYKLGEIKEI